MLKISLIYFAVCLSVCIGIYVAKGKCPKNEEYLLCGSACPANCTSPNPVGCQDDCVEGCFCLTGYLRNENGTCVNADKCVKPSCEENEEFLPCGTVCPSTCSVPEPEVCGIACSMGCFCKEGFYRDEASNKCVTLDKCPAETNPCFNENETYDMCNASCEPSCTDPEPICTKECTSGCICATGLLRSPEGDCVSVDKCPPANGTAPGVLDKYLNTINKILHLTVA